MTAGARRPSAARRLAAALALATGTATAVAALAALAENVVAGLVAVVALVLAAALAWQAVLRSGAARLALLAGAVLAVGALLAVLATQRLVLDLVVIGLGAALTAAAVRRAFGPRGAAGGPWAPAPPPRHPVVLINPHSGGGAAQRAGLAEAARARGVRTRVLGPGDDLEVLAREEVADGADVLGMAGGDGSLAIVATVAAEHGLPFVCVPAGTRNHFALDLGLRREDVAGALDAFGDGLERRIDLAEVNERVFLNNVSLGVYAEAVRRPGYRDAKLRTLADSVRAVLGPGRARPELRFTDDTGREHASAAVVLVSNNPYAVDRALGRGTRPRIDGGRLGVVVLGGAGGHDRSWSTVSFDVAAGAPAPAGVDGEAVTLQPPLRFATRPAALLVRIPRNAPGVSPAALLPPRPRDVLPRLLAIAAGRPSGSDLA
jgi:diacylglycerol kinase family enzyme